MSFKSPDAAVIRIWGVAAFHQPVDLGIGPFLVKIVRDDEHPLEGPVLAVYFGTMVNSGFTQMPAKNDTITVGGRTYRIFEIKTDMAGPTDDSQGIWLSLVAQ